VRFAIIIAATLAAACGNPQDDAEAERASFSQKLKLGRRVGAPMAVEGASLALTDTATLATTVDAMTGAPRHALFDAANGALYGVAELPAVAEALAESTYRPWNDEAWALVPRTVAPRLIDAGLAVVSFSVRVDDVDVRDGTIDVWFVERDAGQYALRELVARHAVVAKIEPPAARERGALERLGLGEPTSERRVIFARERGLDLYTYEYADEVTVGDLVVTLGSTDGGTVLEAYSHVVSASTVTTAVHNRSYLDTPAARPASFATLFAANTARELDATGTNATTVDGAAQLRLDSPRVRVNGRNTPVYQVPVTLANGRADVVPTGANLNALNAFLAIQRINGFTRRHLKDAEAAILSRPVALSLDVQGSCNAFYTQTSISLYRAGMNCANMAAVNDVIYHEWGHGLDDYTGTADGITDGAFSEGIGDILASYMVDDANMGLGFFTDTTNGVRNLKNTARFPEGRGEVHVEGQIIGGAFWDLRVGLVERYGKTKGAYEAERLFFQHLLTTDSYRDSYDAVLRLDDDDADPATPSPNRCLINAAFTAHGLASAIPDCKDDAERFGYKADPTLAAGFLDRTATGARLMAAGGKTARKMMVCVGAAQACSNLTAAGWQAMTLDGTLPGDRVAFVTPTALPVVEGSLVWLAAYDGAGQMIGRRAVKLVTR